MRNIRFLIAILVVGVATASGATMCTSLTGTDVINTASFACSTLSGLTFSNFSAMNAGNVPSPSVFLVSVQDSANSVVLGFNPSLLSGNQDIWFYFQVSGYVTGVNLANAGTGTTSIAERVCDSLGISQNICVGSEVGTLSAASGQSAQMTLTVPQTSLFIFKDIGTGANGHLSSFGQSFESVPEPVTFGLIGSGLLVLGLLRRRRRG